VYGDVQVSTVTPLTPVVMLRYAQNPSKINYVANRNTVRQGNAHPMGPRSVAEDSDVKRLNSPRTWPLNVKRHHPVVPGTINGAPAPSSRNQEVS
jgi:hypothetical protein